MPLGGGLELIVQDANTGNVLLRATGDLNHEALEIADTLLQVPATGTNGVNTIITIEPAEEKKLPGAGGTTIHKLDDGGYEQPISG